MYGADIYNMKTKPNSILYRLRKVTSRPFTSEVDYEHTKTTCFEAVPIMYNCTTRCRPPKVRSDRNENERYGTSFETLNELA